jgi:transcriptional regulator with GAF, ATPase, and Fis domain
MREQFLDVSTTGVNFEAMLVEIGRELLAAPPGAMDAAFTRVLARLIVLLGIEGATIALFDSAPGSLGAARCAAAAGEPHVTTALSKTELTSLTPQFQLHQRSIVVSTETDRFPEVGTDRPALRASGLTSIALLPITAGTRLLGVLSLGRERAWDPALIDRLNLVAKIFAAACLREERDRKLQASLAEAEALRERIRAENEQLHEGPFVAAKFDDIVGESAALRDVLFMAEQVAPTDATVLLLGETGTGKELVAHAIHAKSHRGGRRLVTVNCAAMPPTLIESELFGHEKGAFTGATARKLGRFELADHGTLFLDEIGELPPALQAKLLRVLQEGEFERVGSTVTRKVDVRVIAASNRDLATAARDGSFRGDLYYRLAVFPIRMPPLRARRDDIPLLAWHFLGQLGTSLCRKIERVPPETMERLVAYGWPGNIRELRNVLERAIILSPGTTLALDGLIDEGRPPVAPAVGATQVATLVEVERNHILRVLDLCGWRIRGPQNAAQRLGLKASTLYSRMKKLGIRRAPPPALVQPLQPEGGSSGSMPEGPGTADYRPTGLAAQNRSTGDGR